MQMFFSTGWMSFHVQPQHLKILGAAFAELVKRQTSDDLKKVAQAAGRVIRTPEDRGVIWLIDDRFMRPATNQLLPRWWFE